MARELERKYVVHDAFVVPDLTCAGPVAAVDEAETVELVATYYDTPDLRLARSGVTLRRRTGGHDAGWTLKLPAGPESGDGRDEIGAPLGRSKKVPPDLADLITAWVRGEELAPVGELATRRESRVLRDADGAPLVEVVDDHVSASGSRGQSVASAVFREVEAELVEGADPAVLDEVGRVLTEAGAVEGDFQPKLVRALGPRALQPPSPPLPVARVKPKDAAGDLLTAYLRLQVRALLDQDVRVRRDEEDSVHKARVATRRLRSALKTFAPLLDAEAVAGLGDELKWLAGELGHARDAEVLLVRLRALVLDQAEEVVLGPVAARVDQRLLGDLLAGEEGALAALRSGRYVALLDRLVDLATRPPLTADAADPVREVVPQRVAKAWRRVEKRLAPADAGGGDGAGGEGDVTRLPDERLHEVRKAAKRARYAAEAAALAYGDPATDWAHVISELQDVLGEHQDAVVARGVLRELGLAAHAAGENAFTFGWLAAQEHEAARTSRAELPAAVREAGRRRHRKWLDG